MAKLNKATQTAAEEAEEKDFSPIPSGVYRAKVKEIDTSTASRSSDNAMWTWQMEIVGGPNDLEDDSHKGRVLFARTVLTEKAAWKIKEVFYALGFELDPFADAQSPGKPRPPPLRLDGLGLG